MLISEIITDFYGLPKMQNKQDNSHLPGQWQNVLTNVLLQKMTTCFIQMAHHGCKLKLKWLAEAYNHNVVF